MRESERIIKEITDILSDISDDLVFGYQENFDNEDEMIKKCPFDDPEYTLPVSEPCPVCGAKGDLSNETIYEINTKCVTRQTNK